MRRGLGRMFRPSSMTRPRRGNEYVAPNSAGNLAASPALSGVTSEKCCGKSLEISLRPSASAMFRACSKYIPAAELVQMRPIPERGFGSVSHYTQHQEEAQRARHDYFPYRDEFHPRSKRLLHEMALNAYSQSLERSGSVASDDTRSVFTLPSTAASRKTGSKASSANQSLRSRSLSSSRLHTGDSLRVGGGQPGMLAKRRAQAFYRSPSQSKFDRDWYLSVLEKEGA
ncbi:unnamed protein product [Symbiodinium natans]|uniref:Uncharacterized protein n=1 Tax=Symbiodinium natans TaxID=878477 RepID=A0A812TYS9_9DINO|nr:unnamed protein product [Symbiodinium natans]